MELNVATPKEQPDLSVKSDQKHNPASSASEETDPLGREITKESVTVNEDQSSAEPQSKISRSMSDGQAGKLLPEEFADVFPSLPDSVLTKLGLLGEDAHRERMTEEEIEQKFISLALAFSIDSTTIKDRCQRQRRNRDQTETNLTAEIDKLIQKVTLIQPLCVDVRTAELLTGLLEQIDIIIRASYHAAISAERFGAVQHEDKLAEAVNLMIRYVSVLKQQREAVRKQLLYTKKVLHDTNSNERPNSKNDATTNNNFLTQRRASIAAIVQPKEANSRVPAASVNGDIRRITRRATDLSARVSALARSARPSRLELGVELGKIKEGVVDNGIQNNDSDESQLELTSTHTKSTESTPSDKLPTHERFFQNIYEAYETADQNGELHNFFAFAAFVCLLLGVIVLGNILVELEFNKRGIEPDLFWRNLFSFFTSVISYFQNDSN